MAESKRQIQKASTRARVVQAATVQFQAEGYDGTNLRDIAKMAGVSTGAIFANFRDKEALYREVFGHAPYSAEQGRAMASALKSLGVDPVLILAAAA
jgi:AcrR family transcriptional regulator